MVIGEMFLSSLVQVLLDKLVSVGVDYAQREGIDTTLLHKCEGMLKTINAVLDDAEDKQLDGDRSVKQWLDNVRDLAYDMEDLLDEFEIEATQVKSEAKSSTSRGQLKRKFPFFSQPCSLVSETKLREIIDRFEDIVKRKSFLSLRENVVDRSHYTNKRLPSTCLPETQFFGREKEEGEILKLLIGEAENGNTTLSIVPIVGMGGIGKTALAQRLYNDVKVSSCFERRAWVCVSDVFDVFNITKTILRSIAELPCKDCEDKDLNELQVKLKDSLSGKKFLVVLDDVWNEKYVEWTVLLKPFEAGANGSKIIVTTRNRSVVSLTGASPYSLKELSVDNCTRLLAFHTLGATNFERQPHLERIGKKIAEKCKGSPLAVKVLGGLLRSKGNHDEWEAILNNRMWDLPMGKSDEVLPVLKLSYIHLPSYLKRCFAYCAVFPKDYEIERDELVLLWIAEGLLDRQKTKENNLIVGQNYFDELVARSFFQQSSVDTSKFLMHDLLNDLAKSIAGATCFTSEESQEVGDEDDASFEEKARYASFVSPRYAPSKRLRAYAGMKVLRSFMLLSVQLDRDGISISRKVLRDLLTNLKYLRVLTLCHCNMKEVPNCVGDLKHLRYLNLSYTGIERLPESIGALCKLQTLILRGCQWLSMLPPNITKLVNLQFLDIRNTDRLKEMPLGIGNLKNLTILSKFVVGPEKGLWLKELKNLPHLRGELFISELQNVEEVGDAVDATLFEKRGLSNLILHWDKNFGNIRNKMLESQVLQNLRPYTNLESLTISHYGGAIFPSWLDGPSYSKIVSLCLRGCRNVTLLPPFGQLPSLKELSLEDLHTIRKIGSEFYGDRRPFSSLITLKFKKMSAWKDWSPYAEGPKEEGPFSCLQHLVIQSCPLLVGTLPCQLDRLIKLEIRSCPLLNNSTYEVHLPSLHELYLEDCNNEILKSLVNLTSLTILKIKNLVELVCFDHGFMSSLVKLRELHIISCDKLNYLWQDGEETRNLTCLQELAIESCPQFTSFVAREGKILKSVANLTSLTILKIKDLAELVCFDPGFMICLVKLKELIIYACDKLTYLWQDGNETRNLNCLENLHIGRCPRFTSFVAGEGETELPYNLKSLNLWRCTSLEKLPSKMHTLRYLSIDECDSLTSFSFFKGRVAALKELHVSESKEVKPSEEISVESLETLIINGCKNLRSLPRCFHMLSHLTRLEIMDCPALEIEDFPPLPNTLSHLQIFGCPKIKSLPNQWHHLTSLQLLKIYKCHNIKCLPKGGLPPNLRVLTISGCKNLKEPRRKWGLPMLTSLYHLGIDFCMGGEGEKGWFPSEDENAWSLLFPSSLTTLSIFDMRNVERLSSGLCNHLSSLEYLYIGYCPELRGLPEDGFPPSIKRLWINGCEDLKDECSKHTYWPLIQEIPFIVINDVGIQ